MDRRAQASSAPLTLSPGTPIPPLPVMVRPVNLTRDGFLEFPWPPNRKSDPRGPLKSGLVVEVPPEELYLRELMELDLADSDAILEFTRRYGRMDGEHWELLGARRWRWRGTPREIERIDELLSTYTVPDGDFGGVSHLEVFRVHARLLRDAVRLWTEATMTGSVREALRRWESFAPPPQDSPVLRDAAGLRADDDEGYARRQAAEFVVEFLTPALAPYHPRFEVRVGGELWLSGAPAPRLYSAMVLQLYNHIAEGARYRHCANENCGRIFVRQRDRAQQGRYRTEGSLKYCSRKCAWAAGQRAWRDRQRKRKQALKLQAQGVEASEVAAQMGIDLDTLAEFLDGGREGTQP
jgi:hypothetical protein